MSDAIVLEAVRKTFGPKVAVEDLNLVIPEGRVYGFIGPNGAGKTTTIRMIMSILFPDQGEISVLGHASALEAKDRIGYLPEERGVYRKMKAGAFLAYVARLKGCRGAEAKRRVHAWLERVHLADVENKRCEELSKGMQQKLQFIAAVIHEPDLIILDEPFSGLDPVNMRLLRDLVLEQHRRGASIIFSTHVMHQAEQLCDHIVMIDNGRKVLDSSLASIRADYDPRTILFEPLDAHADPAPLHGVDGVEEVRRSNGAFEIALVDGLEPSSTMSRLVSAMPAARVELNRPTLEDVFIQIVTEGESPLSDDVAKLRASLRDDATVEVGS
jgi:ABC-2 type transport system ATP-binding protein